MTTSGTHEEVPEEQTAFRMPTTKAEAQAVMRGFDIRGLKVVSIEANRIYALTGPKLELDGEMRRNARTVVLEELGDQIICRFLVGWIVTDDDKTAIPVDR